MSETAQRSWIGALRSRVSPLAWFAIQMMAGAAVVGGATWLFVSLAEDVVNGDAITVLDAHLAVWFHRHATEPLTRFMLVVSLVHGIVGVSAMSAVFAAWLAWRRQHYWLLTALLAIPGGMVLNALLKLTFHRPRPVFDDPIVSLLTYSFPSGHTLAASVFYATLTAYLLTRIASSRVRTAVTAFAAFMVLLVALSRLYLGAHFLSDVLAAAAEGIAWVGVCLMAVATLQRARAFRRAPAS